MNLWHCAWVAKLVDAQDLKSCGSQIPCRFKSGLRHQYWRNTQVWLKGPVLKTGRSETARGFESLFLRQLVFFIAGWSSLVARWAHNPKVVGSNPTPATIWFHSVVVITSACHAEDHGFKSRWNRHFFWLHSSVGRAKDWKSLCRWFDSSWSHHFNYRNMRS